MARDRGGGAPSFVMIFGKVLTLYATFSELKPGEFTSFIA